MTPENLEHIRIEVALQIDTALTEVLGVFECNGLLYIETRTRDARAAWPPRVLFLSDEEWVLCPINPADKTRWVYQRTTKRAGDTHRRVYNAATGRYVWVRE